MEILEILRKIYNLPERLVIYSMTITVILSEIVIGMHAYDYIRDKIRSKAEPTPMSEQVEEQVEDTW